MKSEALRLAELSCLVDPARTEWSRAVRRAQEAGVRNSDYMRARLELACGMLRGPRYPVASGGPPIRARAG